MAAAADGSTALTLHYRDHRILAGKPSLEPLPATYVEDDAEAETLEVTLADEPAGIEVALRFTIFRERPVIARSATIRNVGSAPADLRCAMSLAVDLPDADWILLGLAGAWARERHVVERRLVPGRQSASSTRGASSVHHNPFLALRRPATDEAHGEAYGFSLVYSAPPRPRSSRTGRRARPARHRARHVRLAPSNRGRRSGPRRPSWPTRTPASVRCRRVPASSGERLARGLARPPATVLINNWEATYFDFDADKLVRIAASARDLGVEMFVLDDGWFGKRDDDTTSLGDWVVDRHKLPDGIDGVAERITALGMGFGIWIEPEMVSTESDLFRAHPDWAIGIPGRPRTESRQQLVLDMARPEVVDHLTEVLTAVLASAPITYVKWDMNRNITGAWSASLPPERQGEFFHRYILVYELYRRLTTLPEILFESCAGGGGRPDPAAGVRAAGLDERRDRRRRAVRIQWGTSLAYRSARWPPTCRPCPTTRSGGSRRSRPARPSRSSGCSATSSTPRR